MVLTPEQIAAITQILRDGSTAVAIRTSGYRVTQSEFDRLKAEGYLPEDLSYADMVEASYRLGQAMQAQPASRKWDYKELGEFLRKDPRPLSVAERNAVEVAQQRAGTFCVGLGNTYSSELGRVLVDADQELAERTRAGIRTETSRAIAERATVKTLKSRLGHLTEDWARDWDRIAITETHQAHQEGVVSEIVTRKGSDAGMAKIPEPDACPACKDLFLEQGRPVVRPASWWMANGTTNAGRKRADWKAVLGAVHPHCRCQAVEVPEGWGFDAAWNLVPLDEPGQPLDKSRTKAGQGYRDQLPGGRADRMLPAQFDSADLGEGTAHELEHTRDRKLAREIAMDHLAEDPKYYKKLRKLEKAEQMKLFGDHSGEGSRGARADIAKAGQGGPFIGPRGGKWADPQHTIPWEEHMPADAVRAHVAEADTGGKHGKPATVGSVRDEDHVRVTVPLEHLDAIDPADTARVKEYAERGTPMPAISASYSSRSHAKGKGTLYVPNGNHRVAAARARGDTHIEAVVPKSDWERWSSRETKPAPEETQPASDPLAVGTVHTLPPGILGRDQAVQFKVQGTKDGMVSVAQTWDGKEGMSIAMPATSLRHFVNDLSGKVDLPATSENTLVNDVINGKGTLLGKGDDGVVFQVGDHVVKMSTTVPYQPMNPGHRTPEAAAYMLEKQVTVGNKLYEAGVPGIQQSLYVQHGDKGFQIKPFVTIPEKLTRAQLDAAQASVLAMHEKGYALRDSVQVGLDAEGNAVLFDIGKAGQYQADKKETMGTYAGMPYEVAHDLEALEHLYRENGETFVHRDATAGEHKAKIALSMSDKSPANFVVQMNLDFALKTLTKEIAALPEGSQRSRLEKMRQRVADEHEFVTDALAAAKKDRKVAKSATYGEGTPLEKARKLHGRMKFQGFNISIENRKGSIRHWHNAETGEDGQTTMLYPYGYIRNTVGADGDHVDVFVGPDAEAKNVYVVRTMKAPDFKLPDEDKCFLGFGSAAEAKRVYLAHYDNPAFFGSMQTLPLSEFRRKVYAADGKLIKAEIKLTEWLWAVDHAGIPFAEFGGVVERARAGEAGDRAKLDEVYAYLRKAGATESLYVDAGLDTAIIGGMGAQAGTKRLRSSRVGEPNPAWPLGREEARQPGRRKKRPLLRGRERFDLKGKHTADSSWVRPVNGFAGVVSMDVARPEVDSAQAHANLLAPQESRASLHSSTKLQTMTPRGNK